MKNNIRICIYCGKTFEINKNKGNTGNICSSCRTSIRRTKLKKEAIEYLGGKCSFCGYNKCIASLDFHHTDPKEKGFPLNKMYRHSKEEIIKELDKCILLCANCHRELHAQDYSIFQNYRNYVKTKEDIITEHKEKIKQKEKDIKNQILDINKNIDTDIDKKSFLNSRYYKRTTKRPETYEKFKQEMDELNWNYCAMGRKYGVSDNAIRKWEKIYQKYGF